MSKITTVVAAASLLAGCFWGPSRFRSLQNASYAEFQNSDSAEWIALPTNAGNITTFSYLGFDTNHRFLKATLSSDPPQLSSLLATSMEIQPRSTNDTFVAVGQADITFDKFTSVFRGPDSHRPTWWKTDFSRFDQQMFCVWQSSGGYGYGYIYLYDSQQKEIRAFQWSEQWNTVANTTNTLGKHVSNNRMHGTGE